MSWMHGVESGGIRRAGRHFSPVLKAVAAVGAERYRPPTSGPRYRAPGQGSGRAKRLTRELGLTYPMAPAAIQVTPVDDDVAGVIGCHEAHHPAAKPPPMTEADRVLLRIDRLVGEAEGLRHWPLHMDPSARSRARKDAAAAWGLADDRDTSLIDRLVARIPQPNRDRVRALLRFQHVPRGAAQLWQLHVFSEQLGYLLAAYSDAIDSHI